jgi:hypothetical protein
MKHCRSTAWFGLFGGTSRLSPSDSGFYQPIFIAHRNR